MKKQYPLAVGEADRLRLERLNKMYNPLTQYFLMNNGLQKGMTVLEVGCGAGDMACWLAQAVGTEAKVVAIDNSPEQITLCKEKAKAAGINNIDFRCLDANEVDTLSERFDFCYGRWVISFTKDPKSIFEKIISILKPGGVLSYETASYLDEGYFSSPEAPIVAKWFDYGTRALKDYFGILDLGAQMYRILIDLGLSSVDTLVNQPVMKTAEEKSVMRLGSLSNKQNLMKFLTEAEYQQFIEELEAFEQSDTIAGFYRNILVAGIKLQ